MTELKFSTLGKFFSAENILKYFLIFPQKNLFFPMETIYLKCQNQFSGKNKKKYHQFIVCCI